MARSILQGEVINVELSPYGNVATTGSQKLIANQALPPAIELIVTDKFGNKQTKKFSVKVEIPPPSPSPSLSPLSPKNPIHKLQQLVKPRGRSEPFPVDGN